MERTKMIAEAEAYVREVLGRDGSGHDWWHADRVRRTACTIAAEEGADRFICELAALLHDVADEKLNAGGKTEGLRKVERWLDGCGANPDDAGHILSIIADMSYAGGGGAALPTLEGRIVQDADRLDALGAIGIARTFAFAGSRGAIMHNPSQPPRLDMSPEEYRSRSGTAVNHFYEKLLRLKDGMNTVHGKRMAEERHRFMERFLEKFYSEWEGR